MPIIDRAFLEMLICPVTRQPLRPLENEERTELNRRIAGGQGVAADGRVVHDSIEAGLVTEDGARVYPVQDGIPVLLEEEAFLIPATASDKKENGSSTLPPGSQSRRDSV